MMIKSGNKVTGVSCDKCKHEMTGDFIYYSCDFISRANQKFSCDICQSCINSLSEVIVSNYNPIRAGKVCELCSAILNDNSFECSVDKVTVSMSDGVKSCLKCGSPFNSKQCACGSNDYTVKSKVIVDRRYLQFDLCNEDKILISGSRNETNTQS